MDLKQDGIYDASTLGGGKMFVLGFQHMFAMFGATVLVPILTGLSRCPHSWALHSHSWAATQP